MPPSIRFGVAYDFRNPPGSGMTMPDLYARTLDQIRFVDQLGYDSVWITEHHFVEDGYMPSFAAAAGAIAAATSRVRIASDVLLLPFQHPIRLAEDLAVLDNLSNGRMMLGVGMGYARHEFQAFGVDRHQRVSLMEEGLAILKRAWTEERLDFYGKRYQFENVRVRPRPVQVGGPPIWIAAMSEAGARRAARLEAHLLPQGDQAAVLDPWRAELAAAGRAADALRVGIIRPWLVTDDPDALWPRIRQAEVYRAKGYAPWIEGAADAMTRQLESGRATGRMIPQTYIIGNAAVCIGAIEAFVAEFGVTDLITWGVPPGLPPELLNENLQRFAHDVMPHFRTAESATASSPSRDSA